MLGNKGNSNGLIGGRDRSALVGALRNVGSNLGSTLQTAGTIGSFYNPVFAVPVAATGSILKSVSGK